MVFSSATFLWFFLPIVVFLLAITPHKAHNVLLLILSLLFYAWGEPVYILVMLASITINWLFGMALKCIKLQRLVLFIGVSVNLIILGYYKYYAFLYDNICKLVGGDTDSNLSIHLPIGISFFTFQAISYLVDVYRENVTPQKNVFKLALYISFFPQLIAGPIVRYEDIVRQIDDRKMSIDGAADGIRRFIYGLAKKIILANNLAKAADYIFGLDSRLWDFKITWVAAICYTLTIYYDFSGYSDMAIGISKICGFELKENFDLPYISTSITEFWRRWHISLGTWFREYVYIPLGGNRKGKLRTCINLLIVFTLTGIWHGASWNFVLWGFYYGIIIVVEKLFLLKWLNRHKILSHIYTLLVVVFGWVMFKIENLRDVVSFVHRMINPMRFSESVYNLYELIDYRTMIIIACAIMGCGFMQFILKKCKLTYLKGSWIELLYCGFLLVITIIMLATNVYNPFIYFRF